MSWGASSTGSVTYALEEATNSSFSDGLRTAYSGSSTSTTIADRSSGTTYYYRVKATKSGYTDSSWRTGSNGCVVSAVTPTVTTTAISSITANSASSGGNVTSDGGATITARGVYWSISANPTIGDSNTTDGTGSGSFDSSITGLKPGTKYYVRAYATNEGGLTGYGEDQVFTTLADVPGAVTRQAGSVTSVAAILNGTVNPNGAETTVGFEWGVDTGYGGYINAIQNPVSGTDDQEVSAEISGLIPGKTYHFRVSGTNSEGIAYGLDESFDTPGADISVQKTVSNSKAGVGSEVVFTIMVTNNGPDNATGIEATDKLPTGLVYINDDSEGFYNSETGTWDVGNLAKGDSATLQIRATVESTGSITNTAIRTASSPQDPNSDNDEDEASVRVGKGAMPWIYLLLFDSP